MQINSLYREILSGGWFMEASALNSYLPFVKNLLEGNTSLVEPNYEAADRKEKVSKGAFRYYLKAIEPTGRFKTVENYDELPEKSVAVLNVKGTVTREDQYCGPMGTRSMSELISLANDHKNIDGLLLVLDTPGGQASGMEEISNALKSFKKPMVAFVDNLAASAGYWIASQSNHIVINGETGQVGSIGTMLAFADIQPALEKEGVKFHMIRATKSQDKNQDFLDIQKDEYSKAIESLDFLNEKFHDAVKSGRGEKLKIDSKSDEPLTGKMYWAQEAIDIGLADEIGDMDAAYAALKVMIDDKQNLYI